MSNTSSVIRAIALLSTVVCVALSRAHAKDAGLIGHWKCDDTMDTVLEDSSPAARDGGLVGVTRVTGAFGTALHFNGENAYAVLPALTELDGSDEMTVQAWVLWEGTGQYPNIITGGQWSPGGFMIIVSDRACRFRLGRPGHKFRRPGDEWKEISVPFFTEIPLRRWVHLAGVFKRPLITTYVDGQEVATAHWDHPVGVEGDWLLGKWSGAQSHLGLMDEVKIYRTARTREQIAADIAATQAGRDSVEYRPVSLDIASIPRCAILENRLAQLDVDQQGRVLSLTERSTGRELLVAPAPLAVLTVNQARLVPRNCHRDGDRFTIGFSRDRGTVELRITEHDDYFRFEVLRVEPADAKALDLLPLVPVCAERRGSMAGMASDADSGICIRALNLQVNVTPPRPGQAFAVQAVDTQGLVGTAVALVAGPIDRLKGALQQVALNESVPVSRLGGPFSMDAEENRGSYLFSHVTTKNVDAWIETARRGGFDYIHFSSGWHKSLGHYQINPARFPEGMADLKATVERIHSAGLRAGMHTLTGCIATGDPWVTPVPDPRLKVRASYTLARPLRPDDDMVYVNEKPGDHDVVWTYSGMGNALRLGTELIRYSAVSYEPPYAFGKCERGAFGTRGSAHAPGTRVDYLLQRYLAFYPDENTDLVDELSECIARAYNTCGFDMIYQDGAEGMNGWHPVAVMRTAIYERLRRPALVEASCGGHHSWWFHSRRGAWDHPRWAPKRFTDRHVESVLQWRTNDFLEPHMGWWALIGPSAASRGMLPDEVEYLVGKTLAIDASMSVQGVQVNGRPPNARQEEYFTLIGWYEKLRMAGWFDQAIRERLGELGAEFRLRQDNDGHWRFRPLTVAKHRITAMGGGSEFWTVRNPYRRQHLRVRLEALYAVEPYDSAQGMVLADFADLEDAWTSTAARGVSQTVETSTDEVKVGDRSLLISASNTTGERRGAWSRVQTTFKPYLDLGRANALGFWVHGDGSGAILNLQLTTPREFTRSWADHVVTLDFTGWRYVEFPFRERSADLHRDHVWPYQDLYGMYRNSLRPQAINSFSIYLNHLPPGEETRLLISSVRVLPVRSVTLAQPTLTVAGKRIEFPVSLDSGQYLEVDENAWGTLFDERGETRERFALPEDWPELDSGAETAMRFGCLKPEGYNARAEVSIFALGDTFGARMPERSIQRRYLAREYDLPREITAGDAQWNRWTLYCRPQERAGLELSIEALAGARLSPGADTVGTVLDAGDDAAAYELSETNQYVKYAYDSSGSGIPASSGVEFAIATSEDAKEGDSCLLFTAKSTRPDARGWAAKGRRCDPPLDLSSYKALAFWLYGDGKGHSFKLQLHDAGGAWYAKVVPVDFTGWRRITCDLQESNIDLGAVEYILLFYNNIPSGTTVACRFDELTAFGHVAKTPVPAMTVNGTTIAFPIELSAGQSLSWTGGTSARILERNGSVVSEVRVGSAPAQLVPGSNSIAFRFPENAPADSRALVRLVKVY